MNPEKKKNNLNNYGRYSSLAIEMVAIILIGTFGGIQLDEWIGWEIPLFTVVFSFGAVLLALYAALKDFIKKK